MRQFLIRTLSAFLFLGLFLIFFFLIGKTGLTFFITVIVFFIFIEYKKLVFSRIKISKPASTLFFLTGSLIFLNAAFPFPSHMTSFESFLSSSPFLSFAIHSFLALLSLPSSAFLGLSLFFYLFFSFWIYRKQSLELTWAFITSSLFGFFYCALAPAFAIRTLFLKEGLFWFFSFLLIAFLHDIFAYLIGRKFGKTKLLPHLSPRKSLEGSFGGFFGAFLALIVILFFKENVIPIPFLIFVTVLLSLSCQTGDFFESFLKRMAHIKDSGKILPGHGGILDRMDSLCISVYVLYAAVLISQTYF